MKKQNNKHRLFEVMHKVSGMPLNENNNISPELNNKIIKRTEEIYQQQGGKTKDDFDLFYDQAIKEFGYDPETYKSYMEKYFTPYSPENDDF